MKTDRLDHYQVFALLGVLLGLLLPHMGRLPYWLQAVLGLLFVWRGWLQHKQWRMPPNWLLLPVVFSIVIGIYLEYRTLIGRTAGVTLLAALVGAKLLETRTRRDALLLVYLGYFLVVTNFLFDQSVAIGLYLTVMVLAISTLLVSWHSLGGWSGRWQRVQGQVIFAGSLMVQALPLMVLLFVFFPRIEGPLWRLPQDRSAATSGLSDTMSPGSFSNMSKDDAVAFRVSFSGERPSQDTLYWRGPVYDEYDGRTWTQASPGVRNETTVEISAGRSVNYVMTLEPHQRPWLLALDMPTVLPKDTRMSEQYQVVYRRIVDKRLRLEMQSALQYNVGRKESPVQLTRALQLPPTVNPRARVVAEKWRSLPPAERVNEALRFFGTQGLEYTLTPPLYGSNAIDDFVFVGKGGFCEHFAGSFVFMMRAAQVPARVVGGYQGGEENGDYLIIRQADAHAWAEVWLEGKGWVRVDPTFAVAPSRIQEGLASAVGAEELPYLMRLDNNLVKRMRLLLDSAVNGWNQWVIGYSPERQRELLKKLGIHDLLSSSFLVWFVGAILGLVMLSAAWLLWHARPRRPDPARQAWDRFCRKLAGLGLHIGFAEAPGDFAHRAKLALPERANAIDGVLKDYLAVRYGSQPALVELVRKVRDFA
ncbi:transglutaminase TgpA family protein [Chitinimonas sp. PSY-7]|uniref:transglutaminaseTgpA domain-containing protein n=1 Tax=Chitinimonas sp. PSY-7 TaxID=3459088 RepID=UPI0040403754